MYGRYPMGQIEVICGSMFSGKSEELIRRLKRARIARQRIQVFKPQVDTRSGDATVTSHSDMKINASIVSSNDQNSSKSPRFARDPASAGARANRNQSEPRQLQHDGQHGRAGQRRAPRVTQIAAQRPQHRRFPPAQHEIGRVLYVYVSDDRSHASHHAFKRLCLR